MVLTERNSLIMFVRVLKQRPGLRVSRPLGGHSIVALPVATTPVRKRISSKRRADGEVGASQTVDILAARTDPEAHGSHQQKGFWRDQFVAHAWNNIPRDLRGLVHYRSFRPGCREASMSIPDAASRSCTIIGSIRCIVRFLLTLKRSFNL